MIPAPAPFQFGVWEPLADILPSWATDVSAFDSNIRAASIRKNDASTVSMNGIILFNWDDIETADDLYLEANTSVADMLLWTMPEQYRPSKVAGMSAMLLVLDGTASYSLSTTLAVTPAGQLKASVVNRLGGNTLWTPPDPPPDPVTLSFLSGKSGILTLVGVYDVD